MSTATQELLQRLTVTASTSVSSPSHNYTHNHNNATISHYHNELQKLRDEGDPSFLFLRTIIELTSPSSLLQSHNHSHHDPLIPTSSFYTQQTQELLFHSILGFRHVTLYRWNRYSAEFRNVCRDYMLAFGLHHFKPEYKEKIEMEQGSSNCISGGGGNSNYDIVTNKIIGNVCLATCAAFWKRGWNATIVNGTTAGTQTQEYIGSTTIHANAEEQHLIQLLVQNTIVQIQVLNNLKELFTSIEGIIHQDLSSGTTPNQSSNNITASSTAASSNKASYMSSKACLFLSNLIGEFSGYSSGGGDGGSNNGNASGSGTNSTAIQYNCSLEFHRLAHSSFESNNSPITTNINATTTDNDGGGNNGGLIDILRIAMIGLGGIIAKFSSNNQNSNNNYNMFHKKEIEMANMIVNLTNDVLSWEFGGEFNGSSSSNKTMSALMTSSSTLVRPPESWREYLIRPDFLGAVFQVYSLIRNNNGACAGGDKTLVLLLSQLKHSLRQLLLLLSSITGIVFDSKEETIAYAGFLADGCLSALSTVSTEWNTILFTSSDLDVQQQQKLTMEQMDDMEKETVDFCGMITKLVANFNVEKLSQLPSFSNILSAISTVGDFLLKQHVHELRKVQGDVECVEGYEWRDEALNLLLEAVVLLADNYWLVSAREGNAQDVALTTMANALSPFYISYVTSRIEMAKMEEHYVTLNAADLDEVREQIAGASMDEEMTAASSLGRLNLSSSLSCLSSLFQNCMPNLQALFGSDTTSDVTPEAAALLEEARLIIICITHLLTDDCSGETPFIPERIMNSCSQSSATTSGLKRGDGEYRTNTIVISQIVNSLMCLGELQASRISVNPDNPNLSPLLAQTLLCFFLRFASAYVLPSICDYEMSDKNDGGILATWSNEQTSEQTVSFCMTLSLHYICFWPQENQVQDSTAKLLLALAKRGKGVRQLIMKSPSTEHLFNLHTSTATMIHSVKQNLPQHVGLSPEMIIGYQRLPYHYRSQMLTVILIASSEINNVKSESFFNSSLQSVQNSFQLLIQAFDAKRIKADDMNTKEMVSLCLELYAGVAKSSEMTHPERIPIFITPSLANLSDLMVHYATDINICEILLRLFRDYTEQFIVMLDREQCLAVFRASAELLTRYSSTQCSSRVIRKPASNTVIDLEEEQSYNDVLCAIQLLLNLGAKDFVDTFSSDTGRKGIDSSEVTEVIFFGLQQILPLMTQGLLNFPSLCKQYFSLVGFMMDSYPKKVGALPFELFNSLLDSLLFGMSHVDNFVSKSSLEGIAALAREQIETQALNTHLSRNPAIFENCCIRLLKEVVFQSIIWDRLEATGMALLPLAAVDINRFATIVNSIAQQLDLDKQQRLQTAFQRLMQPDVMSKIANGNFGGRQNRLRFKKDFEVFVKDIHSTVLIF